MAVTLKVTPEELKALSGQMKQEIEVIERHLNNINKKVNGTKSYWRGDASDFHGKKYEDIRVKIQDALKILKKDPDNLLQIAGLYVENENQSVNLASSLPDDILV